MTKKASKHKGHTQLHVQYYNTNINIAVTRIHKLCSRTVVVRKQLKVKFNYV